MIKNRASLIPLIILSLAIIMGCGGGGDDQSGSITPFSVVPADVTVNGDVEGECAIGAPTQVLVSGGTAPYKLYNAFPSAMALNKTQVDHPGETFVISLINGVCLEPGLVVVVDALERQLTIKIVNKKGEAES